MSWVAIVVSPSSILGQTDDHEARVTELTWVRLVQRDLLSWEVAVWLCES
jgi:hypothetical protein